MVELDYTKAKFIAGVLNENPSLTNYLPYVEFGLPVTNDTLRGNTRVTLHGIDAYSGDKIVYYNRTLLTDLFKLLGNRVRLPESVKSGQALVAELFKQYRIKVDPMDLNAVFGYDSNGKHILDVSTSATSYGLAGSARLMVTDLPQTIELTRIDFNAFATMEIVETITIGDQ